MNSIVQVVDKPSDSKLRGSLEMVELKQLVEKQNESGNSLVAALKDGSKPVVAIGTEQSEMSSYIQELSKAVEFLLKKVMRKPINQINMFLSNYLGSRE